jgi:hypothetical protein
MALSYEGQKNVKELEYIQEIINEVVSTEGHRNGMGSFVEVKRVAIPLLEKYKLQYVANELNVEWQYIPNVIKDFSEEILFVLQSEIEKSNPSWKHQLLLKKVFDMTGYKYIKFQEIINSLTAK